MTRNSLLPILLLCALTAACSGGESAGGSGAASDDDDAPQAETAAAGQPADAIGRCAVDARDGAPYGRIAGAETDVSTGESTYRIEGDGGTVWNKKAANIRVVDCPAGS